MCGTEADNGLGGSDGIGGVVGPLFRCSNVWCRSWQVRQLWALVQSRNWWLLAKQLEHNCFLWISLGDRLPSFVGSVDIYARGGSSTNTDRILWASELALCWRNLFLEILPLDFCLWTGRGGNWQIGSYRRPQEFDGALSNRN